jgi:hypothetical protein
MSNERWAVIDCSKWPSESNCQLKMMAPESQMENLLTASVAHMCEHHGGKQDQETRDMARQAVEFQ